MSNIDSDLAEFLLPPKPRITVPPPRRPPVVKPPATTTSVSAAPSWSLGEADKVKQFYRSRFGRDLPVSAEGQSRTHNRLGLDHRNGLDVPVSPSSDEGRELVSFLSSNNIPHRPITAADVRRGVKATGAHIHIGNPSRGIGSSLALTGQTQPSPSVDPDLAEFIVDAPAASASVVSGVDEDLAEFIVKPETDEDGGEIVRVNARSSAGAPAAPTPLPRRPAFDVNTQEGRAERDAHNRLSASPDARVKMDVPLPSGKKDWAEVSGVELAQAAVRQHAGVKGIPSDFTETWLAKQGQNIRAYDMATRAYVEPKERMGDPESFDIERRVFRVSQELPLLKRLEGDYKASRGAMGRVSDWATDDERSSGEKLLDVVTPPASAALGAVEYASRPFTNMQDRFWTRVRGGTAEQAREAAPSLFSDTPTPDYAKNPVGEALRHSESLRGINKNFPTLAATVAEMIVDPTNLIGLGVFAKGGKILRASKTGAKHATLPDLNGEIVAHAKDGRKYLLNKEENFLIDLATGEQVNLPPTHFNGRPIAEIAETPAIVDHLPALIKQAELRAKVMRSHAGKHPHMLGEAAKSTDEADEMRRVLDAVAAHRKRSAAPAVDEDLAEFLLPPAPRPSLADRALAPFGRIEARIAEAARSGSPRVMARTAAELGKDAAGSVLDLVSLPKSFKASADLSALGRQALPQVLAHPSYIRRAMREQMRSAVSQDAYEDFARSVAALPEYKLMQESGLYLASPLDVEFGGRLPRHLREEAFASGIAGNLPVVKQSQRAYNTALDSVRLQAWENYTRDIAGKPNTTRETYKAIADLINISTGRGSFGRFDQSKRFRQVVAALNVPAWSPRTMASRFNLISPLRLARNAASPATRSVAVMQLRDAARGLATLSTTAGLLSLVPGVSVGVNPLAPEFGKVRAGSTVIDISGGMGYTISWMARMAQSFYRMEQGQKLKPHETPTALTKRYLRSQLSPSGKVAADWKTGKTFTGETFEWGNVPADLLVPFTIEAVREAYEEEGLLGVAKVAPVAPFLGVSTYEQKGAEVGYQPPVNLFETETTPATKELKRLKINVPPLKNVGAVGQSGETTKMRSSGDWADLASFSPEEDASARRMDFDEIDRAIESAISDADYQSFKSDADKREYLINVAKDARKRSLNQIRLDLRGSDIDARQHVREQQDRLSRGEHLRRDGVGSNRLAMPDNGRQMRPLSEDERDIDKGRVEISEPDSQRLARALDGLRGADFERFAKQLDEASNIGLPQSVVSGTLRVTEGVAGALGAVSDAHSAQSKKFNRAGRLAKAMRLLATERALRPVQYERDVMFGRYGQAMKREMEKGKYHSENTYPFEH